jgi:hypothetical protein
MSQVTTRPAPTQAGSLADRARQRRESIRKQNTERFTVPGYDGIIEAEYRLLDWKRIGKVQSAHDRLRRRDEDLAALYSAADLLIAANVDIYDLGPAAGAESKSLGLTWGPALARELGVEDLPDNCTARQALLAILVVESRVIDHFRDYERWQQGHAPRADEEAVRDFEGTA